MSKYFSFSVNTAVQPHVNMSQNYQRFSPSRFLSPSIEIEADRQPEQLVSKNNAGSSVWTHFVFSEVTLNKNRSNINTLWGKELQ